MKSSSNQIHAGWAPSTLQVYCEETQMFTTQQHDSGRWPSRSPDLHPIDPFLVGYLKIPLLQAKCLQEGLSLHIKTSFFSTQFKTLTEH